MQDTVAVSQLLGTTSKDEINSAAKVNLVYTLVEERAL